jgi:hypothetical protein
MLIILAGCFLFELSRPQRSLLKRVRQRQVFESSHRVARGVDLHFERSFLTSLIVQLFEPDPKQFTNK